MKTRSKFRLCLLVLAALLFTCIPCSPLLQKAEAGTTYYLNLQLEGIQNYSAGHEMMTYINQERRAAGVPDLTLDKELTDVAMQRAAEIAYDFSHTRPNGTKCQTACSSGRMWGENIAAGNSTVYATHMQWMNSPPHKQSLLTSTHRGIGIGHFYHNGAHFWVQVFSRNVGYVETRTGSVEEIRNFEIIETQNPLYFRGYSGTTTMYNGDSTRLQVAARNQGWGAATAAFRRYCFQWNSSNPSVVTVNQEGDIQAVGVGTAVITATTKIGSASTSLTVNVKKDFYDVEMPELPDAEYTGSPICPPINLSYKGQALVEGRDYTVEYERNVDSGSAIVTVTGIGDFIGSRTLNFYIAQKDIENEAKLSLSSWNYGYADPLEFLSEHLTVTYDGKTLVENQDYEIGYYSARSDEQQITEYQVTFVGNYSGFRRAKGIDLAEFSYIPDQYYTGKAVKPVVAVYLQPNIYNLYKTYLTEGVDYKVQYSNNVKAGKATITILPLGDNFGKTKTTFKIVHPPYTVKFNGNKGTAIAQSKTINFNQKYGTLPTAMRKGYTFIGWYTKKSGGTKVTASTTYNVAGNRTLYAHWKKVTVNKGVIKGVKCLSGKKLKVTTGTTKDAKGYQVVIATNSKFSKNKKSLTGTSKVKTFSQLKKAKYYVKVRAYKVDSTGNKVYGAYSKVKTIKVK